MRIILAFIKSFIKSLTENCDSNKKKLKFKFLKMLLHLFVKDLLLLMNEPEITAIEIEENNFKARFLYEIAPFAFINYMSYIPELNESRKKRKNPYSFK